MFAGARGTRAKAYSSQSYRAPNAQTTKAYHSRTTPLHLIY